MQVWDISVSVSATLPVWPGDPPILLERYMAISAGDVANVSHLACSVHVGTHVDAPIHFVDGSSAVENLPLDILIGPTAVVELLDVDAITADCLEALALPSNMTRLLFKTRNSELWADPRHDFYPDFVALTGDLADEGKKEDYAEAHRWIKKGLRKSLPGFRRERFMFVPGNHDVDRAAVRHGARALQETLIKSYSQTKIASAEFLHRTLVCVQGRMNRLVPDCMGAYLETGLQSG